ncbi:unknown [Ruminococcus sp. CAG:624]|nr:unknown [Ruminococcus sp. CAG:624]
MDLYALSELSRGKLAIARIANIKPITIAIKGVEIQYDTMHPITVTNITPIHPTTVKVFLPDVMAGGGTVVSSIRCIDWCV